MATLYYKEVDGKVLFSGTGEMIYYVPEYYFKTNKAYSVGEVITVMGIFPYGLYDKDSKEIKIGRFKCPTMIDCRPSSITKEKSFTLKGSKEPTDYRLLHFKNNDELLSSIFVAKDVDNVEKFVNLLIGGHLPDDIPYDELIDYVIANAKLNDFSYKVSNQIIGLLLSELCRDPNDLSTPFRLKKSTDMNDFTMLSVKKIPKFTSPYAAFTSENADEAIAAAITVAGDAISPLEKVMMG